MALQGVLKGSTGGFVGVNAAATDSTVGYSQHHQMASRAATTARAGLALVLMPAELHRLLVQQR